MDYEKKYDELMAKIEAVKKDPKIGLKDGDYYNGYVQKGIRSALDYLLQEESEDERIRKILIHIVKGAFDKYGIKYRCDEISEEKILAYLEKQKEPRDYRKLYEEVVKSDWLKSLRPQPHWKPSEEQIQMLDEIILLLKNRHSGDIHYIESLESLYDDLQKLL